jgi:hypothetical protein
MEKAWEMGAKGYQNHFFNQLINCGSDHQIGHVVSSAKFIRDADIVLCRDVTYEKDMCTMQE